MRFVLTAFVAWSVSASAASAADASLYEATVVVTGRDNLAERRRGIEEALPVVISKVAADPELASRALAGDPPPDAEAMVERFDYLDRKEGLQVSDEQGTRDRSFELTVHFEPAAVDAIVRSNGGEPWVGDRPVLFIELTIETSASTYRLTDDGPDGYSQRLALADAADALGLTLRLPQDAADRAAEGEVLLSGVMSVTGTGRWNSAWTLRAAAKPEATFDVPDTTFDLAFEEAMRRTASQLAAMSR